MRSIRLSLIVSASLLAVALPALALPRAHRGPTGSLFTKRGSKATKPASQRAIAPERATEIQNALIKQGYMSGAAPGTWDATTQAAMEKYQSDNGWQTKLIPDSRAIIKLGLGPNESAEVAGEAAKDRPVNAIQ